VKSNILEQKLFFNSSYVNQNRTHPIPYNRSKSITDSDLTRENQYVSSESIFKNEGVKLNGKYF